MASAGRRRTQQGSGRQKWCGSDAGSPTQGANVPRTCPARAFAASLLVARGQGADGLVPLFYEVERDHHHAGLCGWSTQLVMDRDTVVNFFCFFFLKKKKTTQSILRIRFPTRPAVHACAPRSCNKNDGTTVDRDLEFAFRSTKTLVRDKRWSRIEPRMRSHSTACRPLQLVLRQSSKSKRRSATNSGARLCVVPNFRRCSWTSHSGSVPGSHAVPAKALARF